MRNPYFICLRITCEGWGLGLSLEWDSYPKGLFFQVKLLPLFFSIHTGGEGWQFFNLNSDNAKN